VLRLGPGEDLRRERRARFESREPRRGERTLLESDRQRIGRTIAERYPEGDRQKHREEKDPEDGLGLAQELAQPREGELNE
jgi:hypothetical protein